jgi:hypothetical protein
VTEAKSTSSENGADRDRRRERRSEGRVRAIYATIILTALLVGLRDHADSASDVLGVLIAGALTLFLAHTFSDFLAKRVDLEGKAHLDEIRELLIVESPLLIAAGVPVIVFLLARAGVLDIDSAFWVSISYAVASLFVIGMLAATRRGIVWPLVTGGVFAGLGAVIIAAEASIH